MHTYLSTCIDFGMCSESILGEEALIAYGCDLALLLLEWKHASLFCFPGGLVPVGPLPLVSSFSVTL